MSRNVVWDNKEAVGIEKYENFVESQNQCALCGDDLEIKVESYLHEFTLKEEAYCINCDIKTRIKDHKIQ